MRHINILLFLFGLLLSTVASAQNIYVIDPLVEKINDNVVISFDANIGKVSTNSMLTITPMLLNGNKQQSLSPIVVIGRGKAITMARKGINMKSGNIIGHSKTLHSYEMTIPFEEWMTGGAFSIDEVFEKCYRKKILSSTIITCNILKTDPIPTLVIASPITPIFGIDVKAAYVKEFQQTIDDSVSVYYVGSGELINNNNEGSAIGFRQGSSVVDESYMDNKNSIRKTREIIKLIKADSHIYVTKLNIVGGSSPEGNFKYNEKIAQDRAESLVDYFRLDVSPDILEVENIGENWDGLYLMVKSSNMDYRDEVLSIINNYSINEGREGKLMSLAGGVPYKYMYNKFFPELRKASCVQVFYDIRPNDNFANIDKASELIKTADYIQALDLLQKIAPTSYTDNLIGVCYMMMDDLSNARTYLQKAIDGGSVFAQENLNKMNDKNR